MASDLGGGLRAASPTGLTHRVFTGYFYAPMDAKVLRILRKEISDAGFDLCDPPVLLGRGTFSVVYAGTRVGYPASEVAIRFAYGTVQPRHHTWVPDLAQLLMSGEGWVVPLLQFLPETQEFPHSCLITIMPRINALSFRRLIVEASIVDVRRYMRSLLRSLAVCAELGIVHRDVKPKNFLWDAELGVGFLTDFGLADTAASLEERARRHERAARVQTFPSNFSGISSGGPVAAAATRTPAVGRPFDTGRWPPHAGPGTTTGGASSVRADRREGVGSSRARQQHQEEGHGHASRATTSRLSSTTLARVSVAARTQSRSAALSIQPADGDVAARRGVGAAVRLSLGVTAGAPDNLGGPRRGEGSEIATGRDARTPAESPRPLFASASPAPAPPRYSRVVHADQPGVGGPCVTSAQRRIRDWPQHALEGLLAAKGDRAGTPGFRAPEVLLGSSHQGTAVDVWSAGIILACLLSRRYPLLPGRDDHEHLACLLALLGPELLAGADAIGRHLVVHAGAVAIPPHSPHASAGSSGGAIAAKDVPPASSSSSSSGVAMAAPTPPVYVPVLQLPPNAVAGLGSIMPQARMSEDGFVDALDLLVRLLTCDPVRRPTAEALLSHPFFTGEPSYGTPRAAPPSVSHALLLPASLPPTHAGTDRLLEHPDRATYLGWGGQQEGADRPAASPRRCEGEGEAAMEDEGGGFPLTPPAAILPRVPRPDAALAGRHAGGGLHSSAVAASASVAAPTPSSGGVLSAQQRSRSPATSSHRRGRGGGRASDAEGCDPVKSAASPCGDTPDEAPQQLGEDEELMPEATAHTGAPEAGGDIGRPREATSPEL